MSRSYKKHPCVKDHSRWAKKTIQASKHKVRRTPVDEDIPNGNYWRKNVSQWDVCDWKIYQSWKGYLRSLHNRKIWYRNIGQPMSEPDTTENYRDWYTQYKRK